MFLLSPPLLAAQASPGSVAATTQATVHGVVTNAATGQPLPRALVRIEGNAEAGALTDGDGRFEIPGVPTGPQAFQVLKPGFRDRPSAEEPGTAGDTVGPPHDILVAAEMPDLVFTLAPTSSIHGQVELSTGDPAEGIRINLLRRTVQDGRADWTLASTTKTNSEGAYRFASLADGVYVMYTEPLLENDSAGTIAAGGARAGYASVFYPDASDLAGAARIRLSPGEQAQANLTLTLEPFQTVIATVALPHQQPSASRAGSAYSAVVMDAAGHQLPYIANYLQETHAIQALLPDGTYSFVVSSGQTFSLSLDGSGGISLQDANAGPLAGTVDFSVSGHEVTNLRVPLSAAQHNPIELSIVRSALSQGQAGASQGRAGSARVMLSPAAGWIGQGMVSSYASGSVSGPMTAAYLAPGSYWAHTNIGQKGLCEQTFTAGGSNLAREPVVIGFTGSASPMTLTLRDDCARLTLSLPQSLMTMAPGEEPFYTVYVVPDFDSTVDLTPITLRPSTGGAMTLEDLTPGEYRVYAFHATARLEYRNPAALAAVADHGQTITLSPGTTGNLVLEVPGR